MDIRYWHHKEIEAGAHHCIQKTTQKKEKKNIKHSNVTKWNSQIYVKTLHTGIFCLTFLCEQQKLPPYVVKEVRWHTLWV